MPGNKANTSKKTGDKLFVAERNISYFSEDADKSLYSSKEFEINRAFNMPDMVRFCNGSFWTTPTYDSKAMKAFYRDRYPSHVPATIREIKEIRTSAYGAKAFEVKLKCPSDDVNEWSRIMRKFLTTADEQETEFFDHASNYNIFEEGSNKSEQSHGLLNMYANIASDYNFLQREYEEVISQDSVQERALPNFYNFLLRSHDSTDMRILLDHRGRLPVSEQVNSLDSNQDRKFTPVSSYYNAWARDLEEWKLDAMYDELNNRMARIEFTKNETEMMEELYKYKEMFPMFNTIEFTAEHDAKFGTVFEETKFMPYLKSYLMPHNETNVQTSEIRYSVGIRDGYGNASSVLGESVKSFYDIDHFFENYRNAEGMIEESIYFSDVPITQENRTYYHLMSIICRGRVEKIKKQVYRTYQDILEGKTAYNEVVFYEVKKYDDEDNLLQTFHFTNIEKSDMIKYVDTQVKYGKRYRYDISSVNVVVGSSYVYKFDRDRNPETGPQGEFVFTVEVKPSVKMVKIPLFEKSVEMIDNPPVAPEISIVPFAGVADKIRVLMDSGVGSYMLEPIMFTTRDEDDVRKFKIAQDLPEESEKIRYESDDHTMRFVMYRTEQEPYSYEDFVNNGRMTSVSTVNDSLQNAKFSPASSAGLDDFIEPNKKYYYCFRSVDYHGHYSYPTEPFSVEIVEDTGSIYPIIRVHEFKKPEEGRIKKGVKRFLSVKPAIRNLLINEELSGFDDEVGPDIGQEIVFGRGPDTIWKKKFKIRLTSKSTGRKVDFNFSFDYKNKSKEEA